MEIDRGKEDKNNGMTMEKEKTVWEKTERQQRKRAKKGNRQWEEREDFFLARGGAQSPVRGVLHRSSRATRATRATSGHVTWHYLTLFSCLAT